MILLDTNVLARTYEPQSPQRQAAVDSILHLRQVQSETLVVNPQVMMEFYAIATRSSNGLKLSSHQAILEIETIKADFPIVPDQPSMYAHWERLIRRYRPVNRQVFDTRHVAFMIANRIPKILTFNDADFNFYSEIGVLNPFDVLKIPRK